MLHTFIFDLDGTTVGAHRQGETLDEWRAMNTPANIMRDSMLPLAEQMRQAILDGLDVVICTSRVMSHVDRVWLNIRGLIAPTIISRDAGDDRHAGEYKLAHDCKNWRPLAAWLGALSLQLVCCGMMILTFKKL